MLDIGMHRQGRNGRFAGLVALGAVSGACLCLAGSLLAIAEPGTAWLWLLAASASFSSALWLWHTGRLDAAGRVVFLTAMATAAMVALTGSPRGLDDRGIMLLPVLGISANVLLRRREALLGMGAVLALLGIVLGAELYAGWRTPSSLRAPFVDFGYAFVLVAVPCIASRLLADSAAKSAERAGENEQALALANECLEAEASRRGTLIQELEGRNTELERFCYTISHDLKSPLVTIGGFLGYVERNAARGDLESLRLDIERISSAHQKMLRLLDDLLELSRAGRKMRPFEHVPFAEVVQEARELCEGTLQRRSARLVVAEKLPMVYGDRLQMVQVVQNLIDNAVKYSDGDAPMVEIGVRRDALKQVLFVRDHGIGIDPAYYDRIFLLFEKLNPHGEGSGVGLALVKRIVELHGGRVWVESDGAKRGSTFCFTLPRPVRTEAAASKQP
jgi:signal transduction histidine kinase